MFHNIKRFFFWLTGGRPMTYIGHAFIDRVSGERVNYYIDHYNRKWIATSRWSLFRFENDFFLRP